LQLSATDTWVVVPYRGSLCTFRKQARTPASRKARDGHIAVAAPQHRLLKLVLDARDLGQRHCRALSRKDIIVLQRVKLQALRGHGAGHDVDQVFVLAQLRQRSPTRR
jgi:hypothetical protein